MGDYYIVDGQRVTRAEYRRSKGYVSYLMHLQAETKQRIQAAADAAGQSMSAYILDAVDERIEREK